MQKHVKNYFESNGYDENSFIKCEIPKCNRISVDIHHIIPRSKFGSKRIEERDAETNLIALCRPCHVDAHANKIGKAELFEIIEKRIFKRNA